MYDVIIIGCGPAGLTAGIYTARANLKSLMLSSAYNPSLITTTDIIENYPGFPEGITGYELVDKFTEQAVKFGLEIVQKDVSSLEKISTDGLHAWQVHTDTDSYKTYSIIMATGTQYAHLEVPGETEFTGKGVSYCATCDGPFYRDAQLVVVGGGDTALQEALFLTKFAKSVTIIHRRDTLRATRILQDRARANNKIRFEWNAVVEEVIGDSVVKGVKIRDVHDPDKKKIIDTAGVFIFTGNIPNTTIIKDIVKLDGSGYINVDMDMKTSAQGIFACGDCTKKILRQVVTACGDGATAAYSAEQYLNEIKGTSYGKWTENPAR